MRRLLSISLLLVFGLPFFSPLLALDGSAEPRLAACCRRTGAHHCMMSDAEVASLLAGQRFSMVGPMCPVLSSQAAPVHHDALSCDLSGMIFAGVLSHPAQFCQVEAWARVAEAGARQTRGPPSVRLS